MYYTRESAPLLPRRENRMVPVPVVAFASVDDLAAFVRSTLCERDLLDPGQTPFFRTPLVKGDRACGVVFHIEGPRLLRSSAVWSADADRIVFYDSTGLRYREVRLSEAPDVARAA